MLTPTAIKGEEETTGEVYPVARYHLGAHIRLDNVFISMLRIILGLYNKRWS